VELEQGNEENAHCYVYIDEKDTACVVVADNEYPEKVAFMILQELYRAFYNQVTSNNMASITCK